MNLAGIGSNNSYMGQMSAMWRNSSFTGMSGPAAQQGAGNSRPDFADIFSKMDKDGSCGVDETELAELAQKISQGSDADTNGDDALDETEAGGLAKMISDATGETMGVDELFDTYDTDNDGALSESETQAALEANRPEGPPPPPPGGKMTGMAGDAGTDTADGIESYLKMAVLGMDPTQSMSMTSGGMTSMFGGSGYSSGNYPPFQTRI